MNEDQQSPEPSSEQRQWVPVPPPNPYAAVPAAPRPGKKWLAVAAMALGLASLLSVLVSTFYFEPGFALLAGVVGLVAVVLGVIALVTRARPLGGGITGIVTGALAIIVAVALMMLGVISTAVGGLRPAPVEQVEPESPDEQWTPDDEQERLLEWPANMATGGIVFSGPGDPRPVPSDPLEPGAVPVTKPVDRENETDVLIYVDYSCPHCALFEQTNGEMLTGLIENGEATVEIVPLAFLDRSSGGSYYSSRASGAMACLAEAQPDAAWAAHTALLDPDVQPRDGAALDNQQLVQLIDGAVGGLEPAALDCIETERFVSFAQSLNQWVFANPVPNADDSESRLQGTPSVFVNGAFYTGPTDDAGQFRQFFEEQKH